MKRMRPYEVYQIVDDDGDHRGLPYWAYGAAVRQLKDLRQLAGPKFGRIARVRITEPRARGRRKGT